MRNPVIPAEEEVAVKKVIEALEELKKLLSESREDEVDESVTEDEVKFGNVLSLAEVQKVPVQMEWLSNLKQISQIQYLLMKYSQQIPPYGLFAT